MLAILISSLIMQCFRYLGLPSDFDVHEGVREVMMHDEELEVVAILLLKRGRLQR